MTLMVTTSENSYLTPSQIWRSQFKQTAIKLCEKSVPVSERASLFNSTKFCFESELVSEERRKYIFKQLFHEIDSYVLCMRL